MRNILIFIVLCLLGFNAFANTSERLNQAAFAPQVRIDNQPLALKSQAVFTYLWADVYAAALYTRPEQSPKQALRLNSNTRLELYYFRAIDRDDVIKAAWTTLEKQLTTNTLEKLRSEIDRLHAQFTDIRPGDRYALNFDPTNGLSLDINGARRFTSPNTELARAYLGIWLAPSGLSDELRNTLLAEQ